MSSFLWLPCNYLCHFVICQISSTMLEMLKISKCHPLAHLRKSLSIELLGQTGIFLLSNAIFFCANTTRDKRSQNYKCKRYLPVTQNIRNDQKVLKSKDRRNSRWYLSKHLRKWISFCLFPQCRIISITQLTLKFLNVTGN